MKWLLPQKTSNKITKSTDTFAIFLTKPAFLLRFWRKLSVCGKRFGQNNVRKMNMIIASRPENPGKKGSFKGWSRSSHSFQAAQKMQAYFLFCVI